MMAYSCEEPTLQAYSTSEMALVRSYGQGLARRLVREGGDTSLLETAIDARDAGDWSTYELVVVELLCADPTAISDSPAPQASTTSSALWTHDRAPPFTLPVLSGAFFAGQPEFESLQDYRGEYVLLDFWASWCGPVFRSTRNLLRWSCDFVSEGFECSA